MKRKKASFWAKVLVILTVLCCIVTLVSQRAQLRQKEQELTNLTDRAAQLTQEADDLETAIAAAGTPEGIAQIARDELGLTQPGDIIFTDTQN